MIEFVYKGNSYTVKRLASGMIVYRDKAHLGGPWSDAKVHAKLSTLDPRFRRRLQHCVHFLEARQYGIRGNVQ